MPLRQVRRGEGGRRSLRLRFALMIQAGDLADRVDAEGMTFAGERPVGGAALPKAPVEQLQPVAQRLEQLPGHVSQHQVRGDQASVARDGDLGQLAQVEEQPQADEQHRAGNDDADKIVEGED